MLKSKKVHNKEAGEGRVLTKVPVEYENQHTVWKGRLEKEAEALLRVTEPDEGNIHYLKGLLTSTYQKDWCNLYSQRVAHLHTMYLLFAECEEDRTYKSKIRKILEGGNE